MDVDESHGERHASAEHDDGPILLQPPSPIATETRKHIGHRPFLPPVDPIEEPRAKLPQQFSTRFILIFTVVVAVVLKLIQQVEPSILAGSCGVAALAYLAILYSRSVRHPIAWAAFWLLLVCYSMLAIRGAFS